MDCQGDWRQSAAGGRSSEDWKKLNQMKWNEWMGVNLWSYCEGDENIETDNSAPIVHVYISGLKVVLYRLYTLIYIYSIKINIELEN